MTTTSYPTEADYFRHDDQTRQAAAQLARTADPMDRFYLFGILGDVEWYQSRLHTAVFGTDPYSDEDPTPAAEWIADSVSMLYILAEAERGRATGEAATEDHWTETYDARTRQLAGMVEPLLHQYAVGGRRRPLVRAMCEVWRPVTRGQAIEGPWCMGLRMPWWSR